MNLLFNNEPARQAFKYFKNVKISGDSETTVLEFIRLDSVIAATVGIPDRNVLEKDQGGTVNRVMADCDSFQGWDIDVDCVESANSSETSTASRRKLYSRGGRISMDIDQLYKLYLPLA